MRVHLLADLVLALILRPSLRFVRITLPLLLIEMEDEIRPAFGKWLCHDVLALPTEPFYDQAVPFLTLEHSR